MPHDCKGTELKVGDEVMFRATVTEVYATDHASNGSFQVKDVTGCCDYAAIFTCNTKHAEKVSTEPNTMAGG